MCALVRVGAARAGDLPWDVPNVQLWSLDVYTEAVTRQFAPSEAARLVRQPAHMRKPLRWDDHTLAIMGRLRRQEWLASIAAGAIPRWEVQRGGALPVVGRHLASVRGLPGRPCRDDRAANELRRATPGSWVARRFLQLWVTLVRRLKPWQVPQPALYQQLHELINSGLACDAEDDEEDSGASQEQLPEQEPGGAALGAQGMEAEAHGARPSEPVALTQQLQDAMHWQDEPAPAAGPAVGQEREQDARPAKRARVAASPAGRPEA